jgi:hypothetical protein
MKETKDLWRSKISQNKNLCLHQTHVKIINQNIKQF